MYLWSSYWPNASNRSQDGVHLNGSAREQSVKRFTSQGLGTVLHENLPLLDSVTFRSLVSDFATFLDLTRMVSQFMLCQIVDKISPSGITENNGFLTRSVCRKVVSLTIEMVTIHE